jgi:5-methylcytosine-specific restriction endonuclease McrA
LAWQKRNPEEAAARARTRRALRAAAPCIPYTQEQLAARLSMFPFCWLCGGPPQAVDHVKPLAKGGWDCLANFRNICHSCNGKKKDKWPFAEALVIGRRSHLAQIL